MFAIFLNFPKFFIMKRNIALFILLSTPLFWLWSQEQKVYQSFDLEVSTQYRYFFNPGIYPQQERHFPSLAIEPSYTLEWQDGEQALYFTGFVRLDRDKKRTHVDIREFYWQKVKNDWELSIGLKKIFWGVTESVHLVDIVNQTDQVESFDGEAKLGQPMVHFSYWTNFGTIDLFAMPYFRERVFPGAKGRLRPPFLLESSDFIYESSAERWRPSFAFRWAHSFSVFDAGLSYFYGTGREPIFQFGDQPDVFELIYPVNHQIGLDLQATTGSILWKIESIYRDNAYQNMFALAAGLEYTFGNIGGSGLDIGLIAEYLYDNREERAISGLDNDLFFGSRLAFNDTQSTEILFGGIFDLEKSSRLFSLEASRRLGGSWKIAAEARILNKIDERELLYFLREDSFMQLSLTKYF